MLDQINICLSNTTHPGNIGAAARAMKVMGLSQLRLLKPNNYPSAQATERASRATDILANAKVFNSLQSAIADCQLIVGTSARRRSLSNPLITPRELSKVIKQDSNRLPIAILFGTENSGLTNQELSVCHYQVYIPTNPEYSSLNIASAVQLIAYEMRLAFSAQAELPEQKIEPQERSVTRQELEGLLQHFDKVMRQSGYLQAEHAKHIDLRINRLLNRTNITLSELNILRGFLKSIEHKFEKHL